MKRNTSHNVFSPCRLATVLPLLLLAGCVSQPQSCNSVRLPTRHPAPPSPATFSRSLRTSMRGRRKWCATIVICWSAPIRRRPSVTLSPRLLISVSRHPCILPWRMRCVTPCASPVIPCARQAPPTACFTAGIAGGSVPAGPDAPAYCPAGPAGPARQLEVDDVQRVVCHSLRDGYQLPVSQLPPPVSSWSTPAPSAVSQPAISALSQYPLNLSAEGF